MGKVLLENKSDIKTQGNSGRRKNEDLVRSIVGSVKFCYQPWLEDWVE